MLYRILSIRFAIGGVIVAPVLWRSRHQRKSFWMVAGQSIKKIGQHSALARPILQRDVRISHSKRDIGVLLRIRIALLKLAARLDSELVLRQTGEHVDDSKIHFGQPSGLRILLFEGVEDSIRKRAIEVARCGLLFGSEFLRRARSRKNQRQHAVNETRILIDLENISIERQVAARHTSWSSGSVEHDLEQSIQRFFTSGASCFQPASQVKRVQIARRLIVVADGTKHLGDSFQLARVPRASVPVCATSFKIAQQTGSRFVAPFIRQHTEQAADSIEIDRARPDFLLQRPAYDSIPAESSKQIVVVAGD